jgi:hypothetical protein
LLNAFTATAKSLRRAHINYRKECYMSAISGAV